MQLSQIEFAAHIGKSRSYVTLLKQTGRLVMVDGAVDVEASLQKIEETKDPGKIGVTARHEKNREHKQEAPAQLPQSPALDEGDGSDYQQARAMKEKYNAMAAKADYEERIRLLLNADDVRHSIADGDTIIRNRLEALPDILAPQLAAESDEQRIRATLTDTIENLLSDLSRSFHTMAKA